MRILSAYYTHKPGGFCLRLYRLLNALAKAGHEVVYLSLDAPPQGALLPEVTFRKIPFLISSRSGLLFWATFTLLIPSKLLNAAKEIKPDRLLAFGAYYSWALEKTATSLNIPIILFMRSLVFEVDRINNKPAWLRKVSESVERKGLLAAKKIVFMTKVMRAKAEEFLGQKLTNAHILPNEVTKPKPAKDIPGPIIRLFAAGVLDLRKNLAFALRALSELPSDIQNKFSFEIAGEGSELNSLKKLTQSLQLTNVKFLGWQSDINKAYENADILIHPSLHEGVSNVIIEAIQNGISVIASDIPEHEEIFIEKTNLFSIAKTEELKSILTKIATDKSYQENLKTISTNTATRLQLDWNKIAIHTAVS